MTASSRGALAILRLSRSSQTVCTRCARSQFRAPTRAYSAATATVTETVVEPPAFSATITQPATSTQGHFRIKSGIILTRAPLLTRPQNSFENAFFFYQKRLNERLTLPFITSVYFKPDTPSLMDWNLKVKERQGSVGKEIGVYNGKASKAWDDELKVGDTLSDQETIMQKLLKDAEMRVSDDAELIPESDRVPVEAPQPRVTEADRTGDVARLDRKLDRTLYLVVKGKDGNWGFPTAALGTDDNLHDAAKRVLDQAAGVNMNTWMVGRVPVAHMVTKPVLKEDGSVERRGEKVFFLKGRIMAGQADLTGNPLGYTEFKWLTKDELEAELAPEYYRSVRNMMADR